MAKTAAVNIAEAQTKDYEARVVREKTSLLEFLLNDASGRYVLEVLNKESGRLKRKRIGYSGLTELSKRYSLLYCTFIDALKFTEEGLEVYVNKSYQIEDDTDLKPASKDKRYFIPRAEFPL